jgi:hypothetical protein
MEWWGPTSRQEYSELSGNLIVRITKVQRKGDLLIAAGIAAVGIVLVLIPSTREISVVAFFVTFMFCLRWFQIPVTELTVNDLELSSQTTGTVFTKRARISWDEIKKLYYRRATRYTPQGFYAKRSFWTQPCLVPDVDKTTTAEIIDAIYRRFPQYQRPYNG